MCDNNCQHFLACQNLCPDHSKHHKAVVAVGVGQAFHEDMTSVKTVQVCTKSELKEGECEWEDVCSLRLVGFLFEDKAIRLVVSDARGEVYFHASDCVVSYDCDEK